MERRKYQGVSEIGYRETDKQRIRTEHMRYLSPQKSSELFKVLTKLNVECRSISSLSKSEITVLYYGHIFTCSIGPEGEKTMSEYEMELYAEVMSDCMTRKYEDVEVYLYQYPRDLSAEEAKIFARTADEFHRIRDKFEQVLRTKDRL